MALLAAWVLFPLLLTAGAAGCGALIRSISGDALPGVLVLPTGFALVVVAADFATMTSATAPFTTPVVVALAVAGLAQSFPWRPRAIDVSAAVAFVGVFAAFAAPVVLSGHATFAGYIKLDDTATWLGLTDRLLGHGRSLAGLAPSSYYAVLNDDLPKGYPVGSFVPLGSVRPLVAQDSAWLFQPYLAFLAGLLALALYSLVGPLVRSRRLRAGIAFVAAQPALLYGYALWGGVKELAAAALLPLVAALMAPLRSTRSIIRATIPIAVATGAVLGALSLGAIVWLGPILFPGLVVVALARGWRPAAARAIAYTAFVVAFAVPVLATGFVFLGQATGASGLTHKNVLGNLFHPLSKLQLLGIWPTGDFRVGPGQPDVTDALIAIVIVAAVLGAVLAFRAGAGDLLLYVAGALTGAFVVIAVASPWVDAKALVTACPAPLVLAMSATGVVFERGHRVEAIVAVAAIAAGVMWSNVLAYHDVTLAPRQQLTELERIGNRFAGQGPTLLNEYSPYGVRHFLRSMAAESPSERRVRPIRLQNGSLLQPGTTADLDDFQLGAILVYRTLVLRRSPTASRPPSLYHRVLSGRFYDVWQRPAETRAPLVEHVSLGSRDQPAAIPRCATVRRVAAEASAGSVIAVVQRPPVMTVELSATAYARRGRYDEDPRVIYLRRKQILDYILRVRSAGRYSIWLGGSFVSQLRVSIDGTVVATRRHELNWPGQFTPLSEIELGAGRHRVSLAYAGPDLHPGSGGNPPFGAGPLVLSRASSDLPVTYVPKRRAGSLCGKRLDWIEAIRR